MRSLAYRLRALARTKNDRFSWAESVGCAALAGVAWFFLAISWRKWPDLLVDFGREIYVPWRLAHGAVLYRDIDELYGPLSKYLNAGLFALFGPGMMILVAANLVLFTGIVTTLYMLFRRAWGVGAALVSSAIFISVFGFSQYQPISNYNYATPYSHEAVHGLLVCLLLVLVLFRWMDQPTLLTSALAGGLFGLTLVLKPEIVLAAGLVTLAALAIRWKSLKPFPFAGAAAWALSAALPTLAFALYFSAHVPWRAALPMACRAWLSVTETDVIGHPIQMIFMGFDHWKRNLYLHAVATLSAILIVAGAGAGARMAERVAGLWRRIVMSGLLLGGIAALACWEIPWLQVGRCFLALTAIYLLACAIRPRRTSASDVSGQMLARRFLIALLAAALMARMPLNGRIYQYGFYQAALAGVLISTVIVFEAPWHLARGRFGRGLVAAANVLLLVCGMVSVCSQSAEALGAKTYAIGNGLDRFYSFSPDVDPKGPIVHAILDRLSQNPPGQTLLVLPEGEMINYLARMPSPLAPHFFYGSTLNHDRELALVSQLREHPPDWVVIISRDLREYGVQRYGELPGEGLDLVSWALGNYRRELSLGDDPLDFRQTGGMLLRRAP